MATNNLTPVTVQRKAHTRRSGVKVKAHNATVQKVVAPAAAEITGPLAGPVGPVEKPANALGLCPVVEATLPVEKTFASVQEAAAEISRLAHAAKPRRFNINAADAERLIEGVLNGDARSFLTFENDGSGGAGHVSPTGDSWAYGRSAINIGGINQLARFDGGGSEDFGGYGMPYGARTEEHSFNETCQAAGDALNALGFDSACNGEECYPDSETGGRTSTQADGIVPLRGSWFAKFAAAQNPEKWGWYFD